MKKRLMLALVCTALLTTTAYTQTLSPHAPDTIRRGNERHARGQYEAAIKEYERVAQGGAGEPRAQALYNMGVCYFELYRTEEAINLYRRAIAERGGRYPKALYALGVALEISNRLEDAKQAYTQALATSEGRYTEASLAVAHYRLGLLAGRQGDYENAAVLFREALKRSRGRFPAAHNNLGVMLALLGRTAEAAREFEIALRQSGAHFEEAASNLKLCRSRRSNDSLVASARLKISDAAFMLTE